MKTGIWTILTFLLMLALAAVPGAATPGESAGEWKPAAGTRTWDFPADHGSHPEYQTEWWYFTGNMTAADGRELGYQLTFFRTGIRLEPTLPGNPWSVRDLYLGHLAVTDAGEGRFHWTERISRAGPGLAGAAEGRLEVWLRDWTLVQDGDVFRLRARSGELSLDLALTPRKPPVLHGTNGLSMKGPGHGQASWYATITDLATEGAIKIPGAQALEVTGRSWFDHEFGSNQLAADQEGWDWFSLHLSDGRELMIYMLRRTDGTLQAASSGTLVAADGSWEHLTLGEIDLKSTGVWQSPRSGGRYPAEWTIRIPSRDIEIAVTPLIPDQELVTETTGGITYWEGAVRVEGRSAGESVTGGGYVELTGYAGGLGGRF